MCPDRHICPTLTAGSTGVLLDTRLRFGATITGTVTGPLGKPLGELWVRLYGEEFPFETLSGPDDIVKAYTDAAGRYVFKRVMSGEYRPAFTLDGAQPVTVVATKYTKIDFVVPDSVLP
ncbi:hypothetical protein GCM10009810_20970 [Nostocoides vanveenii]|uniref:Carboxypeptidase regulatory-like domain-containing protein n=1 Tax=Nostocoides vanveenii TaxID=330835 RepID=A0ABN2KRC0_9MICO